LVLIVCICGLYRYNKKEKQKELQVIQQGIRLPKPDMMAKQPLPPADTRPTSLPVVAFPTPFLHALPDNTAGKAKVRGNPPPPTGRLSVPIQLTGLPVPQFPVFIMPASAPQGEANLMADTPASRRSHYYQKRKQARELAGNPTRKYARSTKPIVCGKCGEPRDAELHKQYFGNWYCQSTASISYEEWKKQLEEKGYGKKKKLV